jgi:hypothetical protein
LVINKNKNMRYLKLFENFKSEIDYDSILLRLKSKGWGDLPHIRFIEFEESDYWTETTDIDKYADEIDSYMTDISTGDYEEYDPYSYEGCGCCPVCTGEKDCECGCPECNYPDELEELEESKKSGVAASLKKKSKASGIPMGILRKVFSKGMQAWNAGHRPGVAQHQWGMGRVNSFITGAGGARKADADLWTKAKAAKARKKKKK